VEPLIERGYSVLAFDAPAHGRSPGFTTNFLEIRDVIVQLAAQHVPLHALIAHSGGCTPAVMAARQLSPSVRVVCFSPLASLDEALRQLHMRLRVSPRVAQAHRERLSRRYGAESFRTFSLFDLLRDFPNEGMIVHDVDDDEVPLQEVEPLTRIWTRAPMHLTRGLGHYRVLREAESVARVVAFIDTPEKKEAAR
jgi:pimeloyl-ACP methyl ester carboxylesterase